MKIDPEAQRRTLEFIERNAKVGKGDFLEGGVRVPAFAWWPGVIEPGQLVGDIIHEYRRQTIPCR